MHAICGLHIHCFLLGSVPFFRAFPFQFIYVLYLTVAVCPTRSSFRVPFNIENPSP